MSRRPVNKGFIRLLATASDELGKADPITALACLLNVSERAIHFYTTGRKACPLLEAKIARVFKVSVPVLRRRLGLK